VAWWSVALALGSGSARALPPSIDERVARERAAEVLRDPELQTSRPDGEADLPPPPERDEAPRRPLRDRTSSGPVQAPSDISQALIWIVLGAIGVALIAVLAGQLGRSWRRRKIEATRKAPGAALLPEVGGDTERLDETLARALGLARAGRFEEAVHVLLAGAIVDLQTRAGLTTEPALTSRELLSRASLSPDPRAAFAELVVVVEVSLFGGQPVTKDDFERCAGSFRTLRQAVAE